MVFLQAAARSESPAAACLRLAEAGQVHLILSSDILAEIGDVLQRAKIVARFPSLTVERVAAFLQALLKVAEVREVVPERVSLSRDPKDAKYLNLVADTSAHYLVSRDKDLLDLHVAGNTEADAVFQHCPGLRIMTPEEFLRAMAPKE
jgi:putative PIN family toxin of toxin-antitoxin system